MGCCEVGWLLKKVGLISEVFSYTNNTALTLSIFFAVHVSFGIL